VVTGVNEKNVTVLEFRLKPKERQLIDDQSISSDEDENLRVSAFTTTDENELFTQARTENSG